MSNMEKRYRNKIIIIINHYYFVNVVAFQTKK